MKQPNEVWTSIEANHRAVSIGSFEVICLKEDSKVCQRPYQPTCLDPLSQPQQHLIGVKPNASCINEGNQGELFM